MNRRWVAYLAECQKKHPKFRVVAKEDSWLMKLIFYGLFMRLWCPNFMVSVTTTIGQTVYMPRHLIGTLTGYWILRHEEKHVDDSRRFPILFQLSYLGPIPIGPFNARWYWEYRAYVVTMQAHFDTEGEIEDETLGWITSYFAGPMYLWMMPFPKMVRRWLEADRVRILAAKS